jgi:hypothetical protein
MGLDDEFRWGGETVILLRRGFARIGRQGGDVDEAGDLGVDARFGDDGAAPAVADENGGTILTVQRPLRRRDVVGSEVSGFWTMVTR